MLRRQLSFPLVMIIAVAVVLAFVLAWPSLFVLAGTLVIVLVAVLGGLWAADKLFGDQRRRR